jgi:hypothetical protein
MGELLGTVKWKEGERKWQWCLSRFDWKYGVKPQKGSV